MVKFRELLELPSDFTAERKAALNQITVLMNRVQEENERRDTVAARAEDAAFDSYYEERYV
jgi:hypothetical protein